MSDQYTNSMPKCDEPVYAEIAKEWHEYELKGREGTYEVPYPFLPLNLPEKAEWRAWSGKNISFASADDFRKFCALGGFVPEEYVTWDPYPTRTAKYLKSQGGSIGLPHGSRYDVWKSKKGDSVMTSTDSYFPKSDKQSRSMKYIGLTGPKDQMVAMFAYLHKSGGWGELAWDRSYV